MTDDSVQNANPYKVGDLVHLISGSPRLAITKVEGDLITCAWFSWPDSHAHIVEFPAGVLYRHVNRNSQSNLANQTYPWDDSQRNATPENPTTPSPFGSNVSQSATTFRFGNADPSRDTPF